MEILISFRTSEFAKPGFVSARHLPFCNLHVRVCETTESCAQSHLSLQIGARPKQITVL
jgi:hypothetical protein